MKKAPEEVHIEQEAPEEAHIEHDYSIKRVIENPILEI